jgi:predicted nucleic acid-binding protein
MQKVIIDTNVMISALIQRSYPYLILYELLLTKSFNFVFQMSCSPNTTRFCHEKNFQNFTTSSLEQSRYLQI